MQMQYWNPHIILSFQLFPASSVNCEIGKQEQRVCNFFPKKKIQRKLRSVEALGNIRSKDFFFSSLRATEKKYRSNNEGGVAGWWVASEMQIKHRAIKFIY